MLFGHSSDSFLGWLWLDSLSSFAMVVDTGLDAHLLEEVFEVFIHLIGSFDVLLVDSLLLVLLANLYSQFKDFSCEIFQDAGQSDSSFLRDIWGIGTLFKVGSYSAYREDQASSGGSRGLF